MKIYQPGRAAQLRMALYAFAALLLAIAWAFDVFGAAVLPLWLILAGVVLAGFGLPRLETLGQSGRGLAEALVEESSRPFPPFPLWLLQQVPTVGLFASVILFGVASGFLLDRPFSLNLGVRLAVVLFAFSLACLYAEPVAARWIIPKAARTAAPRPPRRRRRSDGSPRR